MITMRLFAEEKRTGTIELLLTSPVSDIGDHPRQMAAALCCCTSCVLAHVGAQHRACCSLYGKPDWKPVLVGYLGLMLQGGCLLAIGTFISTTTRNQIIAGGVTFFVCLLLWVLELGHVRTRPRRRQGDRLPVDRHALRDLLQRRHRYQRRDLLSLHDFLRPVPHVPLDGIAAVEGIT